MGQFFKHLVPGSHRLVAVALGASALLACDVLETERTTDVEAEPEDEIVEEVSEAPTAPSNQMAHQQQRPAPGSGIAKDPAALSRARTIVPTAVAEPTPVDDELEGEELPDEEADIEPLTHRIARQTLTIRTEPSESAPLRGRIPMSEAFEVFAFVDGEGPDDGCDGMGWGEVGGGYVCLDRTRKAGKKQPRTLPKLRDRDLTPYYYAKVAKGQVAHQWASIEAFHKGADPVRTLQPDHDYAFVSRRISKGTIFLIDAQRRAVPEKDVRRFYPSSFEGVSLLDEPVPEGQLMAWTIAWPETPARAEANPEAELAANLDYHARLFVEPEPVAGYYRLVDGTGFVHESDLRVFVPPPALEQSEVAGDTWVDVDLDQQILTIMKGKEPVFATLISSGFKGPTPRGVFRIRLKQAVGSMASDAGADDPYNVEAVPHVQYFFGGIALHSAYWHNRFGHRMSHGCVNLSPKDAKTVYEATGPHHRDGWLHAYESESDLGTTVRIRDAAHEIRDRREPVEAVYG